MLLGRAEVVRELGAVDQGHGDAGSTPRRDKEPLQKKNHFSCTHGEGDTLSFLALLPRAAKSSLLPLRVLLLHGLVVVGLLAALAFVVSGVSSSSSAACVFCFVRPAPNASRLREERMEQRRPRKSLLLRPRAERKAKGGGRRRRRRRRREGAHKERQAGGGGGGPLCGRRGGGKGPKKSSIPNRGFDKYSQMMPIMCFRF